MFRWQLGNERASERAKETVLAKQNNRPTMVTGLIQAEAMLEVLALTDTCTAARLLMRCRCRGHMHEKKRWQL